MEINSATDNIGERVTGIVQRTAVQGDAGVLTVKVISPGNPNGIDLAASDDDLSSGIFDVSTTGTLGDSNFKVTSTLSSRARVYEALPFSLLGLNGLTSYSERVSHGKGISASSNSPAPMAGSGSEIWFNAGFGGGKWEAESSSATKASDDSTKFDFKRNGFAAGVNIPTGDITVGASLHHRRLSADVQGNAGKIKLSGTGLGVSATYHGDGFYIDTQIATTRYKAD